MLRTLPYSPDPWESMNRAVYAAKNGSNVDGDGSYGNPYASVKHALSTITDNGVLSRHTILIGPGMYSEDNPIQMKPWVAIKCIGDKATTVVGAANATEDLFVMCDRSFLEGFILMGNGCPKLVNMSVAGKISIDDVFLLDADDTLYVNHANAECIASRVFLQSVYGTIGNGVLVEAGKVHLKDLSLIEGSTCTTLVKADGANAEAFVWNVVSDNPAVTNGLYADNGGTIKVFSTFIENPTCGMRIGSGGGTISARAFGVLSSTYDLCIESSSGVFRGHNCRLNRDKVHFAAGASIYNHGYDGYTKKDRVLGDFAVGLEGKGSVSQFGEGGSYEYCVVVKTYDGSAYSTLTTLGPISFPNVNAGTCIYFGNGNIFYGLKYLLNTAINYGVGNIVWEYYDSNGSWLEFDVLNTINHYSDRVNIFSSIDEIYTLRFDQDIVKGVYESDVTATGIAKTTIDGKNEYWIRCRIATGITTSPEFASVRLKSNYTIIRADGTRAYHGQARTKKILELILGTDASGVSNESLAISTNLTYPYRENEMATAGANEAIFGRFIIPAECDLSCGLCYYFEVTNKTSPASDEVVHLTVRAAGMESSAKFDGTNSETLLDDWTFTIEATDAAWESRRRATLKRFDISTFAPGDVIYFKLHRPNDGSDTYGNSICIANHYVCYRTWQDGVFNKN